MPITSRRTKRTAWVLTGVFVAVDLASYYWNLWERVVWWDETMHLVTTFAFTLLGVAYLYGRTITGAHTHPVLFVLTVMFVGLALGSFWEFYEWGREAMTEANVIKGRWDTMTDLLMDTIGAAGTGVAAVVARGP